LGRIPGTAPSVEAQVARPGPHLFCGPSVAGQGFRIFVGISAPHGTPGDIVERLNKEISAAVANDKFRERIVTLGDLPLSMPAADFTRLASDETEKWAKVIRVANIKAE